MSWLHVVMSRVVMRRKGARLAACLLPPTLAIALLAAGCSQALAQKAAATPVLPGGDSKQPINIDAAKLDYFDKEQKLVYTGDVVATQGDSTLKATVLVLFLTPKNSGDQAGVPSSSSQLRRMEASGPVTLLSKGQVGTGDSGVYEKAQNTVYLIGNVTLTQGTSVTKGDKLTYDLTTNQAVVTGHVRSLFIPNNGPANAPENGQGKQPNNGTERGGGSAAPGHKKPAKAKS